MLDLAEHLADVRRDADRMATEFQQDVREVGIEVRALVKSIVKGRSAAAGSGGVEDRTEFGGSGRLFANLGASSAWPSSWYSDRAVRNSLSFPFLTSVFSFCKHLLIASVLVCPSAGGFCILGSDDVPTVGVDSVCFQEVVDCFVVFCDG